MRDGTKGLDEILNAVTNFTYDSMAHPGDPLVGTLPTMNKATAKQALLDWHNKQIEEAMAKFSLKKGVKYDVRATDTVIVITPANKLKETK